MATGPHCFDSTFDPKGAQCALQTTESLRPPLDGSHLWSGTWLLFNRTQQHIGKVAFKPVTEPQLFSRQGLFSFGVGSHSGCAEASSLPRGHWVWQGGPHLESLLFMLR